MRQRPYSWRRRVRRSPRPAFAGLLLAPRIKRGDGAPSGASLFNPRLTACAPLAKGARRSALHRGFSVPGAVTSGRGPGRLSANPIRAAFAALRPRRVQPTEGQSPVVGTDGDPGPPECEVTSLARGRRTWLHRLDVPRRRPQPSQAVWNIILLDLK